jgi:hypothetical protein
MVSVVQRQMGRRTRAAVNTPITVKDVLNLQMIAYPLVTRHNTPG